MKSASYSDLFAIKRGGEMLAKAWGTNLGSPPEMCSSMVMVGLLPRLGISCDSDAMKLRTHLRDCFGVEVPIYYQAPQDGEINPVTGYARISHQVYNVIDEYYRFRDAVNKLVNDGITQVGEYWEAGYSLGEKEEVYYRDEKVGVKQVGEYWEAGHKIEYRIIEYQLDPAPDYTEVFIILDPAPDYTETCRWYVCKLYMDAHGGPQDSVESELKTETVGKMEETVEGVPCGNAVRKILEWVASTELISLLRMSCVIFCSCSSRNSVMKVTIHEFFSFLYEISFLL
ncbi:hypothetical protein Vadar_033676 [Vaccinium darrowii]|uniref:Uncharacterized protein n=1 Tax=Vaccinium darrowii TaxID=229202 RepID=A0ACB7X6H8_9ERIC|nr:hypothetical protein Vadar_033676 [Vaccinium darrowii]